MQAVAMNYGEKPSPPGLANPAGRMLLSLAGPLFVTLNFLRFFVRDEQYAGYIAISIVVIGLTYLISLFFLNREDGWPRAVVSIFTLFGLIGIFSRQNDVIEVLPQFLANVGFAWAAFRAPPTQKASMAVVIALIAFFVSQIMAGIDPEEVFVISRNFISILLILAISCYYFSCEKADINPSLLLAGSTFPIFLWGIGRAGIISGLLLVAGTFFLRGRKFIPILAGVGIFFMVAILPQVDLRTANSLTFGIARFEVLSGESQRGYINAEYFHYLFSNFQEFLFGVPVDTVRAIVEVDGNPHNSFISLHIGFSIFGVIFLIGVLYHVTRNLLSSRQLLVLLMLAIALFRSAFDSSAFNGPLDFVIFYAIFIARVGGGRPHIGAKASASENA